MYQHTFSEPESTASSKPTPPVKKVLQSCLSTSWGGLEMVAYENALALTQNNFECHTLCLINSPLEKHLNAAQLPKFSVGTNNKFFDFLKIRRFILENAIEAVLVQKLSDLRPISIALINQKEVKVFAISHTLLNITKKDLWHHWCRDGAKVNGIHP